MKPALFPPVFPKSAGVLSRKAELAVLTRELQNARRDLAAAYGNFNQAVDPELVEACAYRISAETARYDYFLRAVKSRTPPA